MPGTERERERADIPRRYVVTRGEGYLSHHRDDLEPLLW